MTGVFDCEFGMPHLCSKWCQSGVLPHAKVAYITNGPVQAAVPARPEWRHCRQQAKTVWWCMGHQVVQGNHVSGAATGTMKELGALLG